MRAEVVGIGTELLLGQIPNSNAREISEALAGVGIDVHHHQAVGDNLERIVAALRLACERSDAVIVTGGLGPTPDDITREAVATLAGVALVRHDDLARRIQEVFERLGRPMPESNLRQADLPEGAVAIPPEGTAPGFTITVGDCSLFALPGVPWEMRAMLAGTVIPALRERGAAGHIASREIVVVGIGESHTHDLIADIVEAQTNPTIAFLAGGGQVRLRITAKAPDEATALGLIRPVESALRERLGDDAVAGDAPNLAEAFGEILRRRGITVACAESLTGGALGEALSGCGGSSDFFLGSIVAYATGSKRDVLGVDEAILAGPGAVSEECARAMAEKAAQRFGADLGLSATGVAGPAEQEGKPVGTVFVGASFGGETEARKVRGYGDRHNVRAVAVTAALDLGRRLIGRD